MATMEQFGTGQIYTVSCKEAVELIIQLSAQLYGDSICTLPSGTVASIDVLEHGASRRMLFVVDRSTQPSVRLRNDEPDQCDRRT
jgi:hypothetical protein